MAFCGSRKLHPTKRFHTAKFEAPIAFVEVHVGKRATRTGALFAQEVIGGVAPQSMDLVRVFRTCGACDQRMSSATCSAWLKIMHAV